MKVRLLSARAGTNESFKRGDVHDFPEHQAKRMIANGDAEPADQPSSVVPMTQDEVDAANQRPAVRRATTAAATK